MFGSPEVVSGDHQKDRDDSADPKEKRLWCRSRSGRPDDQAVSTTKYCRQNRQEATRKDRCFCSTSKRPLTGDIVANAEQSL